MAKLQFAVELQYDDKHMHGKELAGLQYFLNEILGGGLYLVSDVTGDEIGKIKILENFIGD